MITIRDLPQGQAAAGYLYLAMAQLNSIDLELDPTLTTIAANVQGELAALTVYLEPSDQSTETPAIAPAAPPPPVPPVPAAQPRQVPAPRPPLRPRK